MIGQQTLHDDAAVGVEDRDDAQYSAAVFAADACFLATRLWCHSAAQPRRSPHRLEADSPIAWLDAAAVAAISR